jgi:hypothetical protein
MWFIRFSEEGIRKEKITVRIFPDEIVLGNLVITRDLVIIRFSVHLYQRKFLNKHLYFSIHVSHISFIPPLVSKSYAPCFCQVRTSPVLLVMSPVHTMRVFVHSIYAWQQIHVWMQTRFQWSEAILDGSRMLRRYVRSVRGFSPYVTVWQAALTGGLEEPICQRTNTNLSALYLFLTCTRPPDFDTDRTIKTRIRWQLQSNEGILLRPHLRTTKRTTPQEMRKLVLT